MLYLEFTHSQSFGTFVRCHMHAFVALGGVAREIVYDNLATAVAGAPYQTNVYVVWSENWICFESATVRDRGP
jgi:transposase